jgi:hypothetical protein
MKFISFGCWNKGDPRNPEYPIYHLLNKLDEFLSTTKVDFIVITGDNYYSNIKKEDPDTKTKYTLDEIKKHPKKVENRYEFQEFKQVTNHIIGGGKIGGGKIAYCNLEHLAFVFNELKRISNEYSIPIYMCTGNHEYKKHTIFMSKTESETESPPVETVRLPFEYDLSYESNLLDIQKDLFKCNKCEFIETGQFVEGGMNFFVINTEDKIDSNNDIIELINQETGKIYIFGHIPILSLKEKKGNHLVVNKYLVDLFCRLIEGITVTYICADTHNYQDISITFENGALVNQVILGTGGTFELDDITDDMTKLNSITLPDKIKQIQIKEAITGMHGFGLFDTDDGSHKFIDFFDTQFGGYKPKRNKKKKRKTKRRSNKRKTKRRSNKRKTKRRSKRRKNNK